MSANTADNWFKLSIFWIFMPVLLTFLACYAFLPLADPDFWWHLKSGELMWLNKGLLQSDPFTYTGDGVISQRETLILKSYWLWQLVAYGFYKLGRFNGIFIFNLMTLLSIMGVTIWQFRQRGVSFIVSAPLLALAFVLLRHTCSIERPQIISFLFATILLGILHKLREGKELGWSLPLLMLLWGNTHGGFVVGDIILVLFAVASVFEYRKQQHILRHSLIWVTAALLASLLNPTGTGAFYAAFELYDAPLMNSVAEYRSTYDAFMNGRNYVTILWALVGIYSLGLLLIRRFYWPEIAIAVFLIWFSVEHMRNVPFFTLCMLPAVGATLQHGLNRFTSRKRLGVSSVLLISATVLLGIQGWGLRQERSAQGEISRLYPTAVADFLEKSQLQGNMFNSYTWGGYLLWRLYPERQVFIDGRAISPKVHKDWMSIYSASLESGSAGKKRYEELLDQYAIDYIVLPLSQSYTGRISPLLKFLLSKQEWYSVYVDAQSYILVRASEKNRQVIERFAFNKYQLVEKIIANLQQLTTNQPNNVINRVSLAEMLIFCSRYDQAKVQIETIQRLQPENKEALKLLNQLNVLNSCPGGQSARAAT